MAFFYCHIRAKYRVSPSTTLIRKIAVRQKECYKKTPVLFFFCFFFVYFAAVKTKGCPIRRAEIIPWNLMQLALT